MWIEQGHAGCWAGSVLQRHGVLCAACTEPTLCLKLATTTDVMSMSSSHIRRASCKGPARTCTYVMHANYTVVVASCEYLPYVLRSAYVGVFFVCSRTCVCMRGGAVRLQTATRKASCNFPPAMLTSRHHQTRCAHQSQACALGTLHSLSSPKLVAPAVARPAAAKSAALAAPEAAGPAPRRGGHRHRQLGCHPRPVCLPRRL